MLTDAEFNEYHRKYSAFVVRLTARCTAGRWHPYIDANDVAQDVWVTFRRRFDPNRGAASTFLQKLVMHGVVTRARRQELTVMHDSNSTTAESLVGAPPPMAPHEYAELRAVVQKMLDELPLTARLAMTAYAYFESAGAAADSLDWTIEKYFRNVAHGKVSLRKVASRLHLDERAVIGLVLVSLLCSVPSPAFAAQPAVGVAVRSAVVKFARRGRNWVAAHPAASAGGGVLTGLGGVAIVIWFMLPEEPDERTAGRDDNKPPPVILDGGTVLREGHALLVAALDPDATANAETLDGDTAHGLATLAGWATEGPVIANFLGPNWPTGPGTRAVLYCDREPNSDGSRVCDGFAVPNRERDAISVVSGDPIAVSVRLVSSDRSSGEPCSMTRSVFEVSNASDGVISLWYDVATVYTPVGAPYEADAYEALDSVLPTPYRSADLMGSFEYSPDEQVAASTGVMPFGALTAVLLPPQTLGTLIWTGVACLDPELDHDLDQQLGWYASPMSGPNRGNGVRSLPLLLAP